MGADIYEDHDGVYGWVLNQVYKLESVDAKYPRIVVGNKLNGFLSHIISETASEGDDNIVHKYASKSLGMIVPDEDGILILDYCGETVSNIVGTSEDVIVPALDFARQEKKRFDNAGNNKLSGYYSMLIKYLESRSS